MIRPIFVVAFSVVTGASLPAHDIGYHDDPFRQLDEVLPTPGEARLASGAPGPGYWQQGADYKIAVRLDDAEQRIFGEETVTYHNGSPHTLSFLWFQLDQNRFDPASDDHHSRPELLDFYNRFDEFDVTPQDRDDYKELLESLDEDEKELLGTKRFIYIFDFENVGGLITPLPLEIRYQDGTVERRDLPAEIWKLNAKETSRMILAEKEIAQLTFDPERATADADPENNVWPAQAAERTFQLTKKDEKNPMQKAKEAAEKAAEEDGEDPAEE